jgi:hypothetical protein
MSKPSKRPGRAARDIHERIQAQAASLRHNGPPGMRSADELPELGALLEAARVAVGKAAPRSIVFEGRTYWLRVCLAAQIEVFSEPGAARPLAHALSLNSDEFGHSPGH